MSEQNDAASAAQIDPLFQPFLEYWTAYIQQANEAAKMMLENFDGTADPKIWRRQWLDAVSKNMDAYLRSPFFLHMLKTNIDTLIESKRRADDEHKEMARSTSLPPASELTELLERLSGVEESVLTRLEQIEGRLSAIENRLGEPGDAE